MSANDLLKRLESLPPRERKKFMRAVVALEEKETAASQRKKAGKKVEWPDVEARAKLIFGDRIFPNMVLFEREESPY